MTKTERKALWQAMRLGSAKARASLWQDAMRLVQRSEHRLRKMYGIEDQDEDMMQEGALAAGRAVDTWDPDRASFATWVLTNVKGAMLDYLNEANKAGIGSKSTAVAMVDMEEGVAYSPELSGGEDMPGQKQDGAIPRSELLTYEGVRIGDTVDGTGYVPEDYEDVETRVQLDNLREVLASLPTDDAYLIQSYYGIGRPKRTLAELCDDLGYSISGIRKRITLLQQRVTHLLESR